MGVLSRKKNKNKKQDKHRKYPVLEIVHPRGYVELFRDPIPAGEIMRRYPRYCIARPDVFEFPWIVVRPESVLVPGKVFYLVPYATLDKLLKAKRQQMESLNLSAKLSHFRSPVKALEWVNPGHKQQDRYYGRPLSQELNCCNGRLEVQDSDNESCRYKESFYKTWNKVRRNLQSQSDDQNSFDLGLDSPLLDTRNGRDDTSPESVNFSRLKSCLSKADSERKRLNLKVHFAASVVMTGSRERHRVAKMMI